MEDYKKKYEDALERARSMCAMPTDKATMEYVFPELKEDNDERIRKAIIAHMHIVKSVNGVDVSEILAWLEKVKDFDKQLEEAYKNSDEVQYKRGYDDGYLEGIVNAKKELEKQGEMDIEMDIEKPITIGKRRVVSGKLKELIDNKDPKSIEETKEKMLAETSKWKWTDEDERIRKWLLNFVQGIPDQGLDFSYYNIEKTDVLAWLEKQGKQKYADKVEPKFKVGDWITNSIETVQITGYDIDYGYQVDCKGNLQHRDTDIIEKEYHLWTIQDAKDGDVLQLGKVTAIFKKYIGNGNCKCYCSVYDGEFEIPNTDNSYGCHNAVPATKEQRDILFQKMHKAGYEWDDEKKETKLLISNGGDFEPELSHKEVTKKSDKVWSKEDDDIQGTIFIVLDNYYNKGSNVCAVIKDWLKGLKERMS